MNMVVFRRCQSALGVAAVMALALVASLVFAAMPAAAVTLSRADAGTFLRYEHGGEQVIGVMAKDSTNNYYCIEADERVEYQLGESVKLRDDDTARRLGWLMDHYRDGTAVEHAAIAVLAHDLLDLKPDTWKSRRVSVMRDNPTLRRKVEQMWEEAGSNAPANATVTRTYAEGTRTGRVTVSVTNAQGKTIAGIRYAATLNGPAVFANGSATVTGISGAEPIVYSWKATGEGEVKASVAYDRKQVDVFAVAGGQDLVRYGGSSQVSGKAVNFSVRKEFVPTLGTAVAAKVVDAGQPVVDTVTSGVDDGDSWASGLELRASGWYFDGLGVGDLSEPVMPGADETAKEFIARLGTMGFRPSAYGEASFTAPGQRVDVRATAEPGGDAAYEAPRGGGFGTWVWAFEVEKLSDTARQYIGKDVVSGFLEYTETNSNRARVSVESTVTEHTGVVGSELSDTITVDGFPDDHGSFDGNVKLGIGADRAMAQVSVWWAGDPNDSAGDEVYRPQEETPPAEDSNHRLIGVWDYPAVNGRIRVGAGAPDAHGDPVHIVAESHGWYVFVWSFDGDDRVMPASSAYDDAWERVRIWDVARPRKPALTTQVEPGIVRVDEPFRDTARIVGDVPEGAYVTFTAYEAVEEGAVPGMNGVLLDEARAEVDHTLFEQTIASPQVRSPKAGLVYWRASLRSRDGDVLVSHELGVEGETVTVEVPDDPPAEPKADPEPEKPVLSHTGAGVVAIIVVGSGAAAAAIGALAFRRRSRR